MNGFGLLIAVAALGVDVGWESGPDGQSYYTIHIEELLLKPLREGQAIVSNVDPLDRSLSRFQIIVGDHAHAISSQPGANGSDVVQHGWRPGANGGTDYLIQVSPARLESLGKGSIIIGQIDPKVSDIRKLYVFSGVQKLPQQLAPAAALPQPPKFLGVDGGMRMASADISDNSALPARVDSLQSNGTQFRGTQLAPAQPAGPGRVGDFPARPTRRTSTDEFPPLVSPQPRQDDLRTSGQPNMAWPTRTAAATGNDEARFGPNDRRMAVTQSAVTQQNRYTTDASQGLSPVPSRYERPSPAYAPPASQAFGATVAAYPPNFEKLIADAKALGAAEEKIAAAENSPPTPAVTPPAETKPVEESGLPLILTTLMLFTSLATNLFLGWLAWSYFWRFRDAVGDATRAQSTLFSTRQAA